MIIRHLKADEIECRVAQVTSKGCSLLLYKTARVDRAILDELFGDLWQNDFKVINGKMYGGIGIYNKELKEWLWRWDCGVESKTEAEKGEASDCFKRAGFKWGIGIELYSAPFIFASVDTEKNENGKYVLTNKFAKFLVKEIDYSEKGNINHLVIVDNKGNQVYKMGQKMKADEEKQPSKPQAPTEKNIDLDVYEALSACSTVKDVELIWEKFKGKVTNHKQLINMCKKRKGAILAKENESNG